MPHAHPTPALPAEALSARPKALAPGERPGSAALDRPRSPGAAVLVRAMRAVDVSQRQVAAALDECPSAIAERCFARGLDLDQLVALARKRPRLVLDIAEQLVRLVDELGAERPATPDALRTVAVMQREAGQVADAVLDALADGVIDEAEQRRIEKEAADVGEAVRQLRRGPRVP